MRASNDRYQDLHSYITVNAYFTKVPEHHFPIRLLPQNTLSKTSLYNIP